MAADGRKKLEIIGQKTIVDQIIHTLTESILRGDYKSGSKLPSEFELMEEMQVSRNSIREAMKILATMGIVEIKRGDGTYICSQVNPTLFDKLVYSMIYDVSSSAELLELRQILDESTVQLAIIKITPEEVEKLQNSINEMKAACRNRDVERMQACDMEFHMLLIESCKNIFFIRILKSVYSIFEKSIAENVKNETIDSKAPLYHQRILDCIVHRDYNKVHRVIADSLATWRERV
ncbi:FadR/GntR family transcriptional regulator [Lachnospiraceae bacterium 54-53]